MIGGRGGPTLQTLFVGSLCGLFVTTVKILILLYVFAVPDRHKPSFSVVKLYLPPHNYSTTTTNNVNQTIYFDLKLRNKNGLTGFYYDHLNLTFSYGHIPPAAMSPNITILAEYVVPGFYQGYKKTAHRRDLVEIQGVGAAALGENVTGRAVFVVDLATGVRYKSMWGKTKSHKLVMNANVEVNYTTGEEVDLKNIKLHHPRPSDVYSVGN